MNVEKFREIIKEREHVDEISHGEWQEGIEACWKKEIEILTEDIPGSIEFLKNECTANEFGWISEIIDDLAEITQSRELVACYKALMSKFPEECENANIAGSIQYAEWALEGGDGKKD